MPTLDPDQVRALVKSIRSQYASAGSTYVPKKVARARGLRLVLQKNPQTAANKSKNAAIKRVNTEKNAMDRLTKYKKDQAEYKRQQDEFKKKSDEAREKKKRDIEKSTKERFAKEIANAEKARLRAAEKRKEKRGY